jgi:type VI secretion system secreted protein Hcp
MGTKIYMQFGDIKGGVADKDHNGWIELKSCHYSADRPVSQTSGSTNRNVSSTNVSPIRITKDLNLASQKMFTEVHAGNGTDNCTIHFVDDKGTYLEYKLSKALLTSYDVNHSNNNAKPTESYTLYFSRIDTRLTPTDGSGSPSSAGYDIPTAKNL